MTVSSRGRNRNIAVVENSVLETNELKQKAGCFTVLTFILPVFSWKRMHLCTNYLKKKCKFSFLSSDFLTFEKPFAILEMILSYD